MVAYILWWIISVYLWVLLLRVLVSFVPLFVPGWTPRGIVLVLVEGIFTLTDPPINWLRKFIKPVRMGNVSLDMSVLVLFIGLQLVQGLLRFLPI